jgi:type IV pilus assembly protein PilX
MMINQQCSSGGRQRGMVLVSSLLLLLVVTIMALSMFRSFGIQEKIAGNMREKQRAVQVATGTQQFAEWWLISQSGATEAVADGNGAANMLDVACGGLIAVTTGIGQAQGQICAPTNPLAAPTTVPYATGMTYNFPNMNFAGQAAVNPASPDFYYAVPGYYITDLGNSARGEVYKIDAYAYGLSGTAIAVIESTLQINLLTGNQGGP